MFSSLRTRVHRFIVVTQPAVLIERAVAGSRMIAANSHRHSWQERRNSRITLECRKLDQSLLDEAVEKLGHIRA